MLMSKNARECISPKRQKEKRLNIQENHSGKFTFRISMYKARERIKARH